MNVSLLTTHVKAVTFCSPLPSDDSSVSTMQKEDVVLSPLKIAAEPEVQVR